MNPSTTDLTLNMQLPNIATVAWAVQGDTLSRQITATLVDGSTAWNPQAGYLGVIRFFKPDGTNGVYDTDEGGNPAVTWSGNVATVKIAQQCLAVPGTVLMSLEFYDTNDARISAFGWAMNVQPSAVTDDEFLSSDYYNILTKQIAGVLGASSHQPYIDSVTKDWMIWDEDVGDYVDSGYSSVGLTGPYFTPAVDASGDISWTNNGGLPNPQTQNIKGPQGVSITSTSKASGTGAPGTTDVYDVNLSNGTVAGQFNVYNGADGQGSPGSQTPLMDGTASAGSATAYSREDHIHPTDSSRASAASLAIVEAGATASDTYQNGTYIDWQGTLYTVINGPIAQGTSFVVGTNLQAVPDGAANDLKNSLNQFVRPNLLDNWYFVYGKAINNDYSSNGTFPVNQRGQQTYSNTYSYTIDRWYNTSSGTTIAAAGNGVTLPASGWFLQRLEENLYNSLIGKTVTLSVMDSNEVIYSVTGVFSSSQIHGSFSWGSVYLSYASGDASKYRFLITPSSPITLKAAKLELGSTQTLAHWDGTNWVLNEIANYAEELAKCQRYYQMFRTQSLRPTYGIDFRPVMASTTPTLDTTTVGGTTYYTASSDL